MKGEERMGGKKQSTNKSVPKGNQKAPKKSGKKK
jgi:hypothetical protein